MELPPGVSLDKVIKLLERDQRATVKQKERYDRCMASEEWRAKWNSKSRAYYQANKEKISAKRAARYEKDGDVLKARVVAYQAKKKAEEVSGSASG
jgi:hypothetical protein